jgi:hypothetical protein
MDEELDQLQEEQQQQDPPSKKRILYDAVSKKYDLGTFEDFDKKLQDANKRKAFYEGVGAEYELGSYDDFEIKIGVKKKDGGNAAPPPTPLGIASPSDAQSQSKSWESSPLNPASGNFTQKPQDKKVDTSGRIIFDLNDKGQVVMPTKKADNIEAHKEAVKNNPDNRGGYIGNRLLRGIGELITGASDNVMNLMTSVLPESVIGGTKEEAMKQWREEVSPISREFFEKNLGDKTVTEKQKDKYDNELITSSIGSLAQTLPAILSPKGAKAIALISQAEDAALQSINSTEQGKALPESTKSVFISGVGVAHGLIDKFGLDKIFGKQSSALSRKIAGKVFADLLKTADSPITKEMFDEALEVYTKSAKQQLLNAVKKLGTAGAVEFVTGTLQEGSTIFAEILLNKGVGKDIFEPTSWGKAIGRSAKAGLQEAIGGFVLGGVTVPFSKVDNYISDKVSQAKSSEDIDVLKVELEQEMDRLGAFDEDSKNEVRKLIDDYTRVNSKIPDSVPNRKFAADKIIERENIEQEIESKIAEKDLVDVAFQPEIQTEIDLLSKKVEDINNELVNPNTVTEDGIPNTTTQEPAPTVDKPIIEATTTAKEQEGEAAVQQSTEPTGQGTTKTTDAVLEESGGLNKEAIDLLKSVGEGSMPTFITKNLEKIASDNGIEVTGKMTATDVVNALKEKQKSKQSIPTKSETKVEETPPASKEYVVKKTDDYVKDKTDNISLAKEILNDLGVDATFTGFSDTNGVSVYFEDANGQKIRVSDHDITNKDRVKDEISLRFDSKRYGGGIYSEFEQNKKAVKSLLSKEQSLKTEVKPIVQESKEVGKKIVPALEKKPTSTNATNSSIAKEIYREVNKMDAGTSAEEIALQYIAGGGTVGGNAINEVVGTVKRASLNTGRKEKNTREVSARDYYKPNDETLDEIAHKLWADGAIEDVTTMDIKNALMNVIRSYNTRLDAAKAYLAEYSPEYIEKQRQEEFYQQYKEEVEAEERAILEMLEKENTDIEEAMADEDYVTKLIEKYEAENEGQNQQSESETETTVSEGTRNKKSASKKEESEKGKVDTKKEGKYEAKAKAIAEKIMAAKVVPDWLKIDDENVSTKGSSAEDLKKVLADAVINMGKLLDKGVEFSQAVRESVKGMIDIHGEVKRKEIEAGFEKYYRENEADAPPPKKPPVETANTEGDGELSEKGITHAAVSELRKLIELPEYEGKPTETHEQLIAEAQKTISENPNAANESLEKMENGKKVTNKDNAILAIYKATIDAEMAKNPTKELLERATRLAKALDISGTELAKAFESRKLVGQEDNITNFLLDKQAAQGTALTDEQIKSESAKYEELKKAKEALEKQLEIEREQYAKDIAELGINKAKAKARRNAKKTDAEYKAERKEIIDGARQALKNIRNDPQSSAAPLFRELVAIAPYVKKYMDSVVNKTSDKLENVINDIHSEFKDVLDGLTKRNVLDILAGEYDEEVKGETRNEKENQIRLLKREAELLRQLEQERLQEEKAKTEPRKVQSNRRIDELKEKIKAVRKINKSKGLDTESPNDATIGESEWNVKEQKRLTELAKRLTRDIAEKKYTTEKKHVVFRKSRKTQLLEDKVMDLENKIRHERSKDEYNKRSKAKKIFDKVMEVLGVRRLVQSALDMSVPFRQGATLISPRKIDVWLKGYQANLKSIFSPKNFERIIYGIRNDPMYHEMIKDGVVFNDLGSADPNLHNEDFRKSFVYKIPIVSEPLKASNRSADAFLNVARIEMYKKLRENLEKKGLTRESDPEAFKYIGNWVMNMTGRGTLHSALSKPAMNAILGNTFYGARLMASRLNLLNPVTYFDPRIPIEAKKEAMKDMAAFTVTTMTIATALAYATGAAISLDPDEPDFLQLRYDDKVYDISGGLVNYVRTALRILKAGYTKATGTKSQGDKATAKAGKSITNFMRNKLSPNTAYGVDAFFGKRYGEEFEPSDIYQIYPMYTDDFLEAIKKEGGLMATTTVLLPNILGIGYGSYAAKGTIDANLEDLLKRNLRSNEMNNEKIINYEKGGVPITVKEFDLFVKKRDSEIEKDIKVFYEKGIGGTPYNKLTPEQVADEIGYIKTTVTKQVKEEMFGKKNETSEDKYNDKIKSKEREEKYKNN